MCNRSIALPMLLLAVVDWTICLGLETKGTDEKFRAPQRPKTPQMFDPHLRAKAPVPTSKSQATLSSSEKPQAPKKLSHSQNPLIALPMLLLAVVDWTICLGLETKRGRMKIPRSTPTGATAKQSRPIYDKNPVQKPDDGNPPSKK